MCLIGKSPEKSATISRIHGVGNTKKAQPFSVGLWWNWEMNSIPLGLWLEDSNPRLDNVHFLVKAAGASVILFLDCVTGCKGSDLASQYPI